MRLELVGDQYGQLLKSVRRSAFRLELQPKYEVVYERETVARFAAGKPQDPTELPAFAEWYAQIRRQVSAGMVIERVRVFEEPPTVYQRWETWIERWNAEAGEVIRTVSRNDARRSGLLAAAGREDFWLLDDQFVIVMSYDSAGRRIHTELTDEEESVRYRRELRELAIRTAQDGA